MSKIYSVGIIGGGVSGVVIAAQLANQNIETVLFEQKESVVNGPPFCHLHAGGNLYPDISDEQCKILMKQSIEMARLFPQSIDKRPTFFSIPKTEKYEVSQLQNRLKLLVEYYKELIEEDAANAILGQPENYYKLYTKKEIDELAQQPITKQPTTPNQWLTNALHFVEVEKLKTPVLLVQEYGWNLFRLAAQAQLALKQATYCDLHLSTEVQQLKDVRHTNVAHNWEITTNNETYNAMYLVNACGYKTGVIDEELQLTPKRLIEFKAAYIAKWQPIDGLLPELIFHGERGTPNGMAQLTPYCDDLYQIHGMTDDITLFKNGLVATTDKTAQPNFDKKIHLKLEKGWNKEDTITRTKRSIEYVAKFVPSFKSATVGAPPLFGAQQIPGNDPTLRVGEVSFSTKFYARSEIIKASSALTVANLILQNMQEEHLLAIEVNNAFQQNKLLENVNVKEIDELASCLAVKRGYPKELSKLFVKPTNSKK